MLKSQQAHVIPRIQSAQDEGSGGPEDEPNIPFSLGGCTERFRSPPMLLEESRVPEDGFLKSVVLPMRKVWRCKQRLQRCRQETNLSDGQSNCCRRRVLPLLLILCILVQLLIFWHVTRQTHAYFAVSTNESSAVSSKAAFFDYIAGDPQVNDVLEREYASALKGLPYVGSAIYIPQMKRLSRGWFNSLATFGSQSEDALHGLLGRDTNNIPLWMPGEMPPPIDSPAVNRTQELKDGGGFYLKLSDALPLDRRAPDNRDPLCNNVKYNLQDLSDHLDTSVVITFVNEPLSTLLRSVHSILNFTPPPLIREILLVDDASNSTALLPGGELERHIPFLPKIRLGERGGIVPARMRGIREAKAPVVVILDSHIEVNEGWLEPQLARLRESPKSFVFPQIHSILATDFSYTKQSGIGCFLTFNWNIQEKASLTGKLESTDPIPSPMHAGGLLAFRKDTFLDLGGYDEGFSFWGAENIELSFRIWMCGARLECTPCAAVYHVFRVGGSGYSLPPGSVWKNRMRTAKIWMGEYFKLASAFNSHHFTNPEATIGDISHMEDLKRKLNCKDFDWFMRNIDPTHEFRDLHRALAGVGEIRSSHHPRLCVDTMGEVDVGQNLGLYQCHGQLGNQGLLLINESKQLRIMPVGKESREKLCLVPPGKLKKCTNTDAVGHMEFDISKGKIRWTKEGKYKDYCLGVTESPPELIWKACSETEESTQKWIWSQFPTDRFLPLQERGVYEEFREIKQYMEKAIEIRSNFHKEYCLDSLQGRYSGSAISVFWCHGELGTQGFTFIEEQQILLAQALASGTNEALCVGPPSNLYSCTEKDSVKGVVASASGRIMWKKVGIEAPQCLTLTMHQSQRGVEFRECTEDDPAQIWNMGPPQTTTASP